MNSLVNTLSDKIKISDDDFLGNTMSDKIKIWRMIS